MNAHLSTTLEVMPPRPATAVALPSNDKRIERIKTFHAGTMNAFRDQMGYAFLAGVEFSALKEQTPQGQFEKVCDEFLPEIPKRTRCRYMEFSKALMAESATVALLAKEPLLLADGKVAEADAQKICKAVHDIADGKTLTEMYRDLGVIRQPKKEAHHPIKELSAKEAAEAEKEQARQFVGSVLGKAQLLLTHPKLHARLSKEEKNAIVAANVAVNNFLRGKLKPEKLKSAIAKMDAFLGEEGDEE